MRKFTNLLRTTLTDTNNKDIEHEGKVDADSQLKMANAKKRWLIDYQQDREKKKEYIR